MKGPANEFHQTRVKVISTAEAAATFLARPERWTECIKSIPNDVMPEVLDDCESTMHGSVGRETQFDPLFRNDEISANLFVLACWLTGCTVFITQY